MINHGSFVIHGMRQWHAISLKHWSLEISCLVCLGSQGICRSLSISVTCRFIWTWQQGPFPFPFWKKLFWPIAPSPILKAPRSCTEKNQSHGSLKGVFKRLASCYPSPPLCNSHSTMHYLCDLCLILFMLHIYMHHLKSMHSWQCGLEIMDRFFKWRGTQIC
jgi:hypothetical protein